eukprot:TRINITY_DN586_c1_g1_i1.p1 TRINITY_DN586_c1_g1~~TRINITY_DN586_c1_g1_i1.p1  ORF type:complete len:748 (+),score=76.37 TRINITY_DN586_c1_g1_i1:332-2575(+)
MERAYGDHGSHDQLPADEPAPGKLFTSSQEYLSALRSPVSGYLVQLASDWSLSATAVDYCLGQALDVARALHDKPMDATSHDEVQHLFVLLAPLSEPILDRLLSAFTRENLNFVDIGNFYAENNGTTLDTALLIFSPDHPSLKTLVAFLITALQNHSPHPGSAALLCKGQYLISLMQLCSLVKQSSEEESCSLEGILERELGSQLHDISVNDLRKLPFATTSRLLHAAFTSLSRPALGETPVLLSHRQLKLMHLLDVALVWASSSAVDLPIDDFIELAMLPSITIGGQRRNEDALFDTIVTLVHRQDRKLTLEDQIRLCNLLDCTNLPDGKRLQAPSMPGMASLLPKCFQELACRFSSIDKGVEIPKLKSQGKISLDEGVSVTISEDAMTKGDRVIAMAIAGEMNGNKSSGIAAFEPLNISPSSELLIDGCDAAMPVVANDMLDPSWSLMEVVDSWIYRKTKIVQNTPLRLAFDETLGHLWTGGIKETKVTVLDNNQPISSYNLPTGRISCLAKHNAGVVVGTDCGHVFSGEGQSVPVLNEKVSDTKITAVAGRSPWPGFIACTREMVFVFGDGQVIATIDEVGVEAVASGFDGSVWMATNDDLTPAISHFKINGGLSTKETSGHDVTALICGPKGVTWSGTEGGGIFEWREGEETSVACLAKPNCTAYYGTIDSFAVDPDGTLWSAQQGVIRSWRDQVCLNVITIASVISPMASFVLGNDKMWLGDAMGVLYEVSPKPETSVLDLD